MEYLPRISNQVNPLLSASHLCSPQHSSLPGLDDSPIAFGEFLRLLRYSLAGRPSQRVLETSRYPRYSGSNCHASCDLGGCDLAVHASRVHEDKYALRAVDLWFLTCYFPAFWGTEAQTLTQAEALRGVSLRHRVCITCACP